MNEKLTITRLSNGFLLESSLGSFVYESPIDLMRKLSALLDIRTVEFTKKIPEVQRLLSESLLDEELENENDD